MGKRRNCKTKKSKKRKEKKNKKKDKKKKNKFQIFKFIDNNIMNLVKKLQLQKKLMKTMFHHHHLMKKKKEEKIKLIIMKPQIKIITIAVILFKTFLIATLQIFLITNQTLKMMVKII